jgi:hypothetical protein
MANTSAEKPSSRRPGGTRALAVLTSERRSANTRRTDLHAPDGLPTDAAGVVAAALATAHLSIDVKTRGIRLRPPFHDEHTSLHTRRREHTALLTHEHVL